MARPSPSRTHEDDRLRLSPASPPSSNSEKKKESTGPRLSQLCPPCATPSSNSSLDYRRSDARIVEDGFAASSGVSKSAKVVLVALRPEHLDPEPALERAAEAVFHLRTLVGHRRRAQEAFFRIDAQHGERGSLLGRDCGNLPLELAQRLDRARTRKSRGARDGGVVSASPVHHP